MNMNNKQSYLALSSHLLYKDSSLFFHSKEAGGKNTSAEIGVSLEGDITALIGLF